VKRFAASCVRLLAVAGLLGLGGLGCGYELGDELSGTDVFASPQPPNLRVLLHTAVPSTSPAGAVGQTVYFKVKNVGGATARGIAAESTVWSETGEQSAPQAVRDLAPGKEVFVVVTCPLAFQPDASCTGAALDVTATNEPLGLTSDNDAFWP